MEIKVQIPDHLSEITITQYATYLNIIEQFEKMKKESQNSDVFYLLKTLEIFTLFSPNIFEIVFYGNT